MTTSVISPMHRRLRQNLTEPERIVWHLLRSRQIEGCKFRRQHPIGPYVADFVCLEYRLIIELDGRLHNQQQHYDEVRTKFLESKGFQVLRFPNIDVYRDLNKITTEIRKYLHPLTQRSEGKESK